MRLLVSGGRKYMDYDKILSALVELGGKEGIEVLIHGAARGADSLAKKAAKVLGIPNLPFPVTDEDWRLYGKFAGPMRNQKMLDEGHPDFLIAFPDSDSRGTWDMIYRAKAAGLKLRVYSGENVFTEADIHGKR